MDINFDGLIGHLKTVVEHKRWVWYYCSRLGMYKAGLLHDLSKFSPTELLESAKYYTGGTSSPINAAKKDKGYSLAWFHHKGRNRHHYEYWYDNIDTGGTKVKMPEEYVDELICDYLGAGRAYMKQSFSYVNEYKWWTDKRNIIAMNEQTKTFVDHIMVLLAYMETKYTMEIAERDIFNYVYLHDTYLAIERDEIAVAADTRMKEAQLNAILNKKGTEFVCPIIAIGKGYNTTHECKYADKDGMCTFQITDEIINEVVSSTEPFLSKVCPIIVTKVFQILKDNPEKRRLK